MSYGAGLGLPVGVHTASQEPAAMLWGRRWKRDVTATCDSDSIKVCVQ